jgi:hypothetical protein
MITAPLDSHIEVIRILAQARGNPNAIAAGLSPIIVAARNSNRLNFPDFTRHWRKSELAVASDNYTN